MLWLTRGCMGLHIATSESSCNFFYQKAHDAGLYFTNPRPCHDTQGSWDQEFHLLADGKRSHHHQHPSRCTGCPGNPCACDGGSPPLQEEMEWAPDGASMKRGLSWVHTDTSVGHGNGRQKDWVSWHCQRNILLVVQRWFMFGLFEFQLLICKSITCLLDDEAFFHKKMYLYMTVEYVTQNVDSRKFINAHLVSSHLLNKLCVRFQGLDNRKRVFCKVDVLEGYFFPIMCYEKFFPSGQLITPLITYSLSNTFRPWPITWMTM